MFLNRSACIIFGFVSILLLPAWGAAGKVVDAGRSAWQSIACEEFKLTPPADSAVKCGYVTVPKNRDEPGGREIQLGVVVLPATTGPRQPDPLFMAQGGPGGSSIEAFAAPLLLDPAQRPTTNRDLVIWDQRGTRYSKPSLFCPELSLAMRQSASKGEEASAALGRLKIAWLLCGERLAGEVGDLSDFNSEENADDVDDIRKALGYGKINFYGVSYGSELSQFVLRQHPESIRSAILDAVVPINYNILTEPAFAMQRIGEKYFRLCGSQKKCADAFPNLSVRYLSLVERLNHSPALINLMDPISKEKYRLHLTGDMLEDGIFAALYHKSSDKLIPLIVDRAAKNDFTYFIGGVLPEVLFDNSMAWGMYASTVCSERASTDLNSLTFPGVLNRLAVRTRENANLFLDICRGWEIKQLSKESLQPTNSAVPVLLMSGDFDPITPPQYAEKLLPHLSRAQHVVFKAGTHGQVT
ncbi:alpha/beta fold hydrolase [Labrys neptuniae]